MDIYNVSIQMEHDAESLYRSLGLKDKKDTAYQQCHSSPAENPSIAILMKNVIRGENYGSNSF